MSRYIALAFICILVTLGLTETGFGAIHPDTVVITGTDASENSTGLKNQMTLESTNSIEEIKNMTSTEMAILEEISLTSTKLATQGA